MSTVGSAPDNAPAAPPLPPGRTAPRRDSFLRRAANWARTNEEHAWRWSARVAVVLPLAALVFAVAVLAHKAWPAIRVNGWSFLYGKNWNYGSSYGQTVTTDGVAHPQGAEFGAWPIIAGTIQSSIIAIVVAVPLSIGAAFALTERLPGWISRPLGFAIEILAGIPSVVIGLWGLLTFGPWLAKHIYPTLASIAGHLPNVWPFNYWRSPVGEGQGLLTAGLVLGMMIIPIIASTTRDLFLQVPPLPKEGGEALGMTNWEVANRITLPWVRSGIIGASVLGLGRALGETIAVALVGGASLHIAPNIYQPFGTIAATILTQLEGALTDGTGFAVATLAELALVLAVISVAVNLVARWIVARTSRVGAPVGGA
jgi:phosphate transport system permease protein